MSSNPSLILLYKLPKVTLKDEKELHKFLKGHRLRDREEWYLERHIVLEQTLLFYSRVTGMDVPIQSNIYPLAS
jgi:hypothetical protein